MTRRHAKNRSIYMDGTPNVFIGEVGNACAIDGLPLVIVEDQTGGNGLDGGPYRIAFSVPAARAFVECLVMAIEELHERHPELLDEQDEFEVVKKEDEEDAENAENDGE